MKFLSTFSLIFIVLFSFAQTESVNYDYLENTFEGRYPLPADKRFNIVGDAFEDLAYVEIAIYKNIEKPKSQVAKASWSQNYYKSNDKYTLEIVDILEGDKAYDIEFKYYRKADETFKNLFLSEISEQVALFLKHSNTTGKKNVNWNSNPKDIKAEVENIIKAAIADIRTDETNIQFKDLSDNVLVGIEYVEQLQLSKSQVMNDANNFVVEQAIDELTKQIAFEVSNVLPNTYYILSEKKVIKQYKTEKGFHTLAIQAGYGVAWFNGGFNKFNYGHAPYAGFGIPLSKNPNRGNFIRNLSINAGVYFLNFKDVNDVEYSGPFIKRPIYVNLGYKFLKIVKFQAGAVLLEQKSNNGNYVNFNKITVRPNISLGLELDLWLGIKNNR
ncbi:MAG: hypothetical protein H6553_12540 [Chitinophagales bacterium]|nr:hypothetical protein [Chitinophagales bacterium]